MVFLLSHLFLLFFSIITVSKTNFKTPSQSDKFVPQAHTIVTVQSKYAMERSLFMKKKFTSLLVFVLLISMVLPAGTSFAAGKKPKLNMKKLNMTVGSTFSLRVYNAKKKHKITFTSSKPSIATVKTETQNARYASVSALAIGSSVITVTVKKGKKVVRNLKCRVRVSPNAVSIKFMKNQVSVPLSQRTRLETIIKPNTSAERPVFESSDESIAIVNSRGVVMGVSPGTVTITATLLSRNLTASCVVTVLPDSTTSSTKPKKYYEKKKLQSIAYQSADTL